MRPVSPVPVRVVHTLVTGLTTLIYRVEGWRERRKWRRRRGEEEEEEEEEEKKEEKGEEEEEEGEEELFEGVLHSRPPAFSHSTQFT